MIDKLDESNPIPNVLFLIDYRIHLISGKFQNSKYNILYISGMFQR